MFEILTLNKIAKVGLDAMPADKYTITDDASANADGVVLRSYKMHDMVLPANLKAIARAGAGVNNIPIDKCSEKGIVVFNTPGANANAVKELVIGSLFNAARNIVDGVNWVKSLPVNDDISKAVEKGKSAFVGSEICGKTLGVIGLGAIGSMVANAAHGLGMDVIGYDPYLSVGAALSLSRAVKVTSDIKKLCETCDYITIHVPYMEATKKTVDEVLANGREGLVLLNFSRGELVDADVLKEELESGRIKKYVTDFASPAIMGLNNVIVTPHLGASTGESEANCAQMAVSEMMDYLENGNIKNSVNFPECHIPWESATRVTIAHHNVPKMLNQFSGLFSEADINIENMLNKSKKDYAYTMIDISGDVPAEIIENIKAIDGVLAVRVLTK